VRKAGWFIDEENSSSHADTWLQRDVNRTSGMIRRNLRDSCANYYTTARKHLEGRVCDRARAIKRGWPRIIDGRVASPVQRPVSNRPRGYSRVEITSQSSERVTDAAWMHRAAALGDLGEPCLSRRQLHLPLNSLRSDQWNSITSLPLSGIGNFCERLTILARWNGCNWLDRASSESLCEFISRIGLTRLTTIL